MKFDKKHFIDYFSIVVILSSSLPFILGLDVPYLHTDEYGYWGSAAYFAGYDWSNTTSTNGYFSYGYGFVLALLFKITNNPIIRFKMALVINSLCIVAMYFALNKIIDNIYENQISEILKKFICLSASMYCSVVCYLGITIPECLLTTLFAINVLVVLTYLEKGTLRYELLLIFISLYSYVLHQRTVIILPLNIIIIFVRNIFISKEKKNLILHCIIIGACTIFLFLGCEYIKKIVQENVWLIDKNIAKTVEISNDYSGMVIKIKYFFSKEGIYSFIFNCLGRIYNMSVGTFGVIIPTIICLIKTIINKEKKYEFRILNAYVLSILILSIAVSSFFMIGSNTATYLLYGRYTDYIIPVMILFIPMIFLERDFKQYLFSSILIIGIGLILNLKLSSEGFDIFTNVSVSQVATSIFYDEEGFNIWGSVLVVCNLVVISMLVSRLNSKWLYGSWIVIFMICNMQKGYYAFEQFYKEEVIEEMTQAVDVAEHLSEYGISSINVIVDENSNLDVIGKNDKYGKIIQFINKDVTVKLLDQEVLEKGQQYYICRKNNISQDIDIIYENSKFLLFQY